MGALIISRFEMVSLVVELTAADAVDVVHGDGVVVVVVLPVARDEVDAGKTTSSGYAVVTRLGRLGDGLPVAVPRSALGAAFLVAADVGFGGNESGGCGTDGRRPKDEVVPDSVVGAARNTGDWPIGWAAVGYGLVIGPLAAVCPLVGCDSLRAVELFWPPCRMLWDDELVWPHRAAAVDSAAITTTK